MHMEELSSRSVPLEHAPGENSFVCIGLNTRWRIERQSSLTEESSRKSEVRSGKLEVGSQKLEIGSQKWEVGSGK